MKMGFDQVLALKKDPPTHYNYTDKVGLRFGRLVVLFYAGTQGSRNKHQFACECDCGNFTLVSTLNLRDKAKVKSCGCLRDELNRYISQEDIDRRILQLETTTPYKVIDCGRGTSDREKWTVSCERHGSFKAVWGNIVLKGTKCPSCACLSRGFNQMIPGHFYLNVIKDTKGIPVAIKYGITNSTPEKRLKWLNFGTNHTIENIYSFKTARGEFVLKMESDFKNEFGGRFLSKQELVIGFTETISYAFIDEALIWADEYSKSILQYKF